MTGVQTHTNKKDQYLIINSEFDAVMDVEVLASAFNMDKAQFSGNRVLVDGFGDIDTDRLAILFADDDTYTPFTEAELTALNTIPAILVDESFFMIYDNLFNFTEQYNGEGLYWNYWFHVWKTFSVSPFANNALFIPGAPTVTSVSVSPATATVKAGQTISLSATVVTDKFAPQVVNWTSNTDGVTVNRGGVVTVGASVTAATEVTITATSEFDATKKDTCVITVA